MKFMTIDQKTWLRGCAGNLINLCDIPDELGNPFQSALDEISANDEEIHSLIVENQKLRAALTPSGETKVAYMGEFSVPLPEFDEDGNEVWRNINVPWTTIKEIMVVILQHAEPPEKENSSDD